VEFSPRLALNKFINEQQKAYSVSQTKVPVLFYKTLAGYYTGDGTLIELLL